MWVIFLRAGAVLPFIAILGESGPLFEVCWDVTKQAVVPLGDYIRDLRFLFFTKLEL